MITVRTKKIEAFLWAFMTAIAYPFVGWLLFGWLGALGGLLLGCAANALRWRYRR
jgi:hypothetical protein